MSTRSRAGRSGKHGDTSKEFKKVIDVVGNASPNQSEISKPSEEQAIMADSNVIITGITLQQLEKTVSTAVMNAMSSLTKKVEKNEEDLSKLSQTMDEKFDQLYYKVRCTPDFGSAWEASRSSQSTAAVLLGLRSPPHA